MVASDQGECVVSADPLDALPGLIERLLKVQDVSIVERETLTLGGARSTSILTVDWMAEGRRSRNSLVMKQDPLREGASMVPLSVAYEYDWYAAVHRSGQVRVPQPLLVERTGALLGSPFMLVRKVEGRSNPHDIMASDIDADARREIVRDAFAQLGCIAGLRIDELGALPSRGVSSMAATAWQTELDYWESTLDTCSLGPLPMVRAAIRRLRAQPPPLAPRPCIVHGDFRLGNFLFTPRGVEAIVDWEMAHVGDPHEDLAWAMSPNWQWASKGKIWGVVEESDRAGVFAAWEARSGLKVDADALRWWQLFSRVKGAALWLKGAHAAADGHAYRLDYILVHWALAHRESARIAQVLEKEWA